MKKYRVSDFKETIDVSSITVETDPSGGTKPSYIEYGSFLAKVDSYDGDLYIEGGERVVNNKYTFILRYNDSTSQIDKSYRITYRGNSYIIHSVIVEDEDRYYIKVIAYRRK
jgi:SPP1 family predicted phage head-tail adaptor